MKEEHCGTREERDGQGERWLRGREREGAGGRKGGSRGKGTENEELHTPAVGERS